MSVPVWFVFWDFSNPRFDFNNDENNERFTSEQEARDWILELQSNSKNSNIKLYRAEEIQ